MSYSPEPDAELLESALYRFEDPAVPGFILPAAGNWAPEEDVWLNVDNPIRDIDGSVTETGCNGEIVSWGCLLPSDWRERAVTTVVCGGLVLVSGERAPCFWTTYM